MVEDLPQPQTTVETRARTLSPRRSVLPEAAPEQSERYADAWRRQQLTDSSIQRTAERRAQRSAVQRQQPQVRGAVWAARQQREAEHAAVWERQLVALRKFTASCSSVVQSLHGDEPIECAICLEELELPGISGAENTLVLPCDPSHAFHAECLEPWLRQNVHCPKCRADLRPLLSQEVTRTMAESIKAFHAELCSKLKVNNGPPTKPVRSRSSLQRRMTGA